MFSENILCEKYFLIFDTTEKESLTDNMSMKNETYRVEIDFQI